MKSASVKTMLTAANAALYAVIGYFTYFGIFVYGVRFWPAVVIPTIFAVLFGPWVGGVGAAIGIFISDMLVHGNPLLSISVGVTANFLGFYLVGFITKNFSWRRFLIGCITGLFIGSLIIGIGIWLWSQVFLLPGNTEVTPLPAYAALTTFAWTFLSEIPFMLTLAPPVIKAAFEAFPAIKEEKGLK